MFLVGFDSSPSPDTLLLLPSGIGVSGIETRVRKLAEVTWWTGEWSNRPSAYAGQVGMMRHSLSRHLTR